MRIHKTALYFFLIIFCIATNASAQSSNTNQRAFVEPAYIDSMIHYEKYFTANEKTLAPNNKSWFVFESGTKPILFIAGHATAQTREGRIKGADGGTGSLAIELNKLSKVPVLYTTYQSPQDPNFYTESAFRDTLAKIIDIVKPLLVIDLHASNSSRPYDVDYGTMNGKSFLNRIDFLDNLISILYKEGLVSQSQDYFPAEKNNTISKFISSKGIPCIQLEINGNYLSPEKGSIYAQKTAQLLQGLMRMINSLSK
jgi:hypothetical protein